jgi:hypothetical protein
MEIRMTPSKNYFAILFILTSSLTIAMEQPKDYPQLQLKNQEGITIITYYAMLTEGPFKEAPELFNNPIKYATHSIHTKLNLSSTIKDPVVTFKIVDDLSEEKFKKVIPLKHTFNLNDGSILTTVKRTGAQLYPKDSTLKDKQFLVKIACATNPKLIIRTTKPNEKDKGTTFAQQRGIAKNEFFIFKDSIASIWMDGEDNVQELIKAGVIKKFGTNAQYINGTRYAEYDTFHHSSNGISNDQQLRQSIIDEQIPTQISYVKALRNRELTGSFRKRA